MKIACFQIEPWQESILNEKLMGHELIIFQEPLSQKNMHEAKEAEILTIRARGQNLHLKKEILSQFPNLKFIATRSTGFDHIDIETCKERKILVSNVPSYGEDSVAEHTFALLLSISRRIPYIINREKNLHMQNIQSLNLSGKTLGVIGSGKIGLKVISLARAFGMNVLAYDIFENQEASKRLNFKYVSLEELLKTSDVITLHTPLTSQTHHIINEKSLLLMKGGAVLINTARGGLVDTKVLLEGLDKGIISFAGLDVIEEEKENLSFKEQPSEVQKIMSHPKIIATSHEAGNSKEARQLAINLTIENILSFIKGYPKNLVYG